MDQDRKRTSTLTIQEGSPAKSLKTEGKKNVFRK